VGTGHEAIKSVGQDCNFWVDITALHNLFNLGGLLVRAEHYNSLMTSAFSEWLKPVV